MLVERFSIIRNYVLSASSQRKYNFYRQNTLLDAFRTNSRNIIGRTPSMVTPLLANQDLMPMLGCGYSFRHVCGAKGHNFSDMCKIMSINIETCLRLQQGLVTLPYFISFHFIFKYLSMVAPQILSLFYGGPC